MTTQTRYDLKALFLLAVLGTATAADAQVQPQLAQRYFEEATKLCERDAGRLWGVSLCGPMVIFDPTTGTRATSQPEPEGPPAYRTLLVKGHGLSSLLSLGTQRARHCRHRGNRGTCFKHFASDRIHSRPSSMLFGAELFHVNLRP
jgi:hypothetical protein